MGILTEGTIEQLYDLRDYINCSNEFDLDTKQQLMDTLTDRIRFLNLAEKMKPLVEEFIQERKEKGL